MDDPTSENGLLQIDALVHFHFGEDCGDDIDRLARLWGKLQFVMQFKGELSVREITVKKLNFGNEQ